ncbi:MAG: hypothetical protein HYV97_03755 [Bdellovibrio sp.]|nr:hypothetical protein [Bdellovibrio sp.]
MFRLIVILCLLGVTFSFYTYAQTPVFQLHGEVNRISLSAPLYLDDYKLGLSFSRIDNTPQKLGPILVDMIFYDQQGTPLKISKSLPVRDDECLRDANQFQCIMRPISLPMVLGPTTCKVKVFLKGTRDVALSNEEFITWGDCARTSRQTTAPDLSWNEEYKVANLPLNTSPFPREANRSLTLTLKNSGNQNTQRPFSFFAIGENEEGEIIWQSAIDILNIVSSQTTHDFSISDNISPWQWHRLCKLRLIADPENKIQEISKLNNELELNFGLCEPKEDKRPDLAPWLRVENDLLTVHLQNISTVDVSPPVTAHIEAFNEEGHSTDDFILSYDFILHGFGDEGLLHWRIGNPDSCRFKVMLDPNDRLRESDRFNNIFELNLCR